MGTQQWLLQQRHLGGGLGRQQLKHRSSPSALANHSQAGAVVNMIQAAGCLEFAAGSQGTRQGLCVATLWGHVGPILTYRAGCPPPPSLALTHVIDLSYAGSAAVRSCGLWCVSLQLTRRRQERVCTC